MLKVDTDVPMSIRFERAVKKVKNLPMPEKIDLLVKAKLISQADADAAKKKLAKEKLKGKS